MNKWVGRCVAGLLFVVAGVPTSYAMLFSMTGPPLPEVYWAEPLSTADNTCMLFAFDETEGTNFYAADSAAFVGGFRSENAAGWGAAVHGNGLYFNGGSDQGADIQGDIPALTDEDASWEFWLKLNEISTQDQVVAQAGSAWQIKIRPNGRAALTANHGGFWHGVNTPGAFPTGVWTHVIFTRECLNSTGETADYIYTVYLDGQFADTASFENSALPVDPSKMSIGYSIWDTSHLNGALDDFRVSRGVVRRTGRFEDNETVFQNPHMGFAYATDPHKYLTWERYDTPENPPDEFQVIKLIIEWADVEPSPGQYDWSEVDEAIALLIEKGHSINARFLLSNGKTEQGVPDWIYEPPYNVGYTEVDNNCKGLDPTRHPYYWDTNFQARAVNILSQLAQRYDGHDISWIDVRIYGHTGEWDAGNNPFPWEDFPSQSKSNVLHQLVDIYLDIFRNTDIPVCINASGWEYTSACQIPVYEDQPLLHFLDRLALGYAYNNGFGIRLDNIRGWPGWEPEWTQAGVRDLYADTNFVVGETGNGWSPDTDPPSNVVDNALSMKMTSLSYGGHRVQGLTFVTNYPSAYQRGMKNIGYRLIPSEVTYPSIIQVGQVYSLNAVWENLAVGRLIKDDYHLRAYLKDQNGTACWQSSDTDFDPSIIVNGNCFDPSNPDGWHDNGMQDPVRHSFARIRAATGPGTYDLYIAIVQDEGLVPAIRLPIDGEDGSLRYYIGQVTVVE